MKLNVTARKSNRAYHNAVIPRKYSQFVQASNKIPPRGDVARYEDTESEDGKGVHESSWPAGGRFSLRALLRLERTGESWKRDRNCRKGVTIAQDRLTGHPREIENNECF